MLRLLNALRFVVGHPLNRSHPVRAVIRFFRWQIGSLALRAPVAISFVDGTRLLVSKGMTGATGNVYAGLHEVVEMAFVLHALREGEDFIDIGANVGSYTVIAAGAVGARCLAIEPIPTTYQALLDNVWLNRLTDKVIALNIGLGANQSSLKFSGRQDTTNHVLSKDEIGGGDELDVPVERLDDVSRLYSPTLIKIDVEGFEFPVLQGAAKTLARSSLLAVIVETNGSGLRYGYSDAKVNGLMIEHGFVAARYEPFDRQIFTLADGVWNDGNTIYVRDVDQLRARVKSAATYQLGTGATI